MLIEDAHQFADGRMDYEIEKRAVFPPEVDDAFFLQLGQML